ncbi:MAG: 23S rRNA (adenine(2030)-N(6))-methyltransferase RlmJ [Rhodospirillales bacterium]|nr:23S rRNA (adenine(2030)-N(6))-methyltransferase RlmJ [Rhodospirillales bacterium]
MNYRHAFHAGNFADVVKHAALCLLVARLAEKPKPFFVLDTHAGLGEYDLLADPAMRTGEWTHGIARVFARSDAPAEMAPYLDAVRALNPDGTLRWYPGSPRLVRGLLRPGDRLLANELHEEDAQTLARTFAREPGIEIRAGDGYVAVKAALPPRERRGLVFIDPPFERKDEFAALARALRQGLRRFATGVFAAWYPVKDRPGPDAFLGEIADGRIARVSLAEFLMHPADDPRRLSGCGLVFVNAPFGFETALQAAWGWCAQTLGAAGGVRIETLVPEMPRPETKTARTGSPIRAVTDSGEA